MRRALVLALLAVGCGRAEPAVSADFKADMDNLCNAVERSGALDEDPSTRPIVVAQWLGGVVKTQEMRDFLASVSQMRPTEKAEAMRSRARQAGVAPCPTADTWLH
jgi:hypothetical protein